MLSLFSKEDRWRTLSGGAATITQGAKIEKNKELVVDHSVSNMDFATKKKKV